MQFESPPPTDTHPHIKRLNAKTCHWIFTLKQAKFHVLITTCHEENSKKRFGKSLITVNPFTQKRTCLGKTEKKRNLNESLPVHTTVDEKKTACMCLCAHFKVGTGSIYTITQL